MPNPLEGMLVLELGGFVSAPYASMMLADLGARVIKIEEPERGDPFRGWSKGGISPAFWGHNRNKESMTLNLKAEDGRKIFYELVKRADIIVVNLRLNFLRSLGLTYEDLSRINERIIYCSITAFGSKGPYAGKPGFDSIGQAMSGMLSLLLDLKQPRGVGSSIADHVTGLYASLGILAGVISRERTGKGQLVETSLIRSAIAFLTEDATRYLLTKEPPKFDSRLKIAQEYGFTTSNGKPLIIHLSSVEKFWTGLLRAVEMEDLAEDPRFGSREDRVKNHESLRSILAQRFAERPREVWLRILEKHDVPCAPIYTLDEVFRDPHIEKMGMLRRVSHPDQGVLSLIGMPFELSSIEEDNPKTPPSLGEHTEMILRWLGYGADEINTFREHAII